MNIFLPYEKDIEKSVQSLDDRRLIKQVLETYQLLQVALGNSQGYKNHPIAIHYSKYPGFLALYGKECCKEYKYRYDKVHKYKEEFDKYVELYKNDLSYIPYYASGSKWSNECIRTTENVSKLYQEKLNSKWNMDLLSYRHVRWTNRSMPKFYNCIAFKVMKGD